MTTSMAVYYSQVDRGFRTKCFTDIDYIIGVFVCVYVCVLGGGGWCVPAG